MSPAGFEGIASVCNCKVLFCLKYLHFDKFTLTPNPFLIFVRNSFSSHQPEFTFFFKVNICKILHKSIPSIPRSFQMPLSLPGLGQGAKRRWTKHYFYRLSSQMLTSINQGMNRDFLVQKEERLSEGSNWKRGII